MAHLHTTTQTARPVRLAPIGRTYLVEVDHRDGSYFAESDHLPRHKNQGQPDALAAVQQWDAAIAVWELNPSEGGMRDVSEDIARLWLSALLADPSSKFDPADASTWPAFIALHLTNDEAAAEYSAARGMAA